MSESEDVFDTPERSPCAHCGKDTLLTLNVCELCNEELSPRITVPQLLVMVVTGLLIDVREGGLVLGRPGPEDDIPMLFAPVPGVLELCALMHGGEFILNTMASAKHTDRLLEINAYKPEEYTPLPSIPLTSTTRVFNTNGTKGPESNAAVLIQTGQFIVNRRATVKFYSELEEINNSVPPNLG